MEPSLRPFHLKSDYEKLSKFLASLSPAKRERVCGLLLKEVAQAEQAAALRTETNRGVKDATSQAGNNDHTPETRRLQALLPALRASFLGEKERASVDETDVLAFLKSSYWAEDKAEIPDDLLNDLLP